MQSDYIEEKFKTKFEKLYSNVIPNHPNKCNLSILCDTECIYCKKKNGLCEFTNDWIIELLRRGDLMDDHDAKKNY